MVKYYSRNRIPGISSFIQESWEGENGVDHCARPEGMKMKIRCGLWSQRSCILVQISDMCQISIRKSTP